MNYFLTILILISFWGCSHKSDPEIDLKKYVEYRFLHSPDKNMLDQMTSGPYNVFINGLDEKQLNEIDLSQKYVFDDLRVIYKKFQDEYCYLAYELTYHTKGQEPNSGLKETVRKIVTLALDKGAWKVHEVENVKTDLLILDSISLKK